MTTKQKSRKSFLLLKALAYTFIIFFVAIIFFYVWGSSATIQADEYASVYSYEYEDLEFETDSFRLMTYNMGYLSGMTNNLAVDREQDLFDNNLESLNNLIADQQIDVLCFQEIDFHSQRSFYINQLNEMADAGSFPHAARAINWDKEYVPFPYWPVDKQFGEVLSGQAVLSRFPILENERIVLAQANNPFYYNAFYLDRLAQVSLLSVGGRDVVLINVHLEAWDARAREKQADQLIALYNRYQKDYPVLIAGDFNSTPPGAQDPYMEETTMEKLFAIPGLRSAIADSSYLKNEAAYFTFNAVEPYIKIDYILYNESKIRVENAHVVKEAGDISDHLPVMADIYLKE